MIDTTKATAKVLGEVEGVIESGQLDLSQAMQPFLKSLKFIKELNKGVLSMKKFAYPSVL